MARGGRGGGRRGTRSFRNYQRLYRRGDFGGKGRSAGASRFYNGLKARQARDPKWIKQQANIRAIKQRHALRKYNSNKSQYKSYGDKNSSLTNFNTRDGYSVQPLGRMRSDVATDRVGRHVEGEFKQVQNELRDNPGAQKIMSKLERHMMRRLKDDDGYFVRARMRDEDHANEELARRLRMDLDNEDGIDWNGDESESLYELVHLIVDRVQQSMNYLDRVQKELDEEQSRREREAEAESDKDSNAVVDEYIAPKIR